MTDLVGHATVSARNTRKPAYQHQANLCEPLVDSDVILEQAPIVF